MMYCNVRSLTYWNTINQNKRQHLGYSSKEFLKLSLISSLFLNLNWYDFVELCLILFSSLLRSMELCLEINLESSFLTVSIVLIEDLFDFWLCKLLFWLLPLFRLRDPRLFLFTTATSSSSSWAVDSSVLHRSASNFHCKYLSFSALSG